MKIDQLQDTAASRGQWLLEGGDDPWEELAKAVGHCLNQVLAGDVLEVVSWSSEVELNVSVWCQETGHELIHVLKKGASTRFWIRKSENSERDGVL